MTGLDDITEEQLGKMNEQAQVEAIKKELKQSASSKSEKFKDELLDFQTFKVHIKQALLGIDIREKTVPAEALPDGFDYPVVMDFVKIPGKGIRKPRPALTDEEKEKVYANALCNERFINDLMGELQGTVNPNLGASKFGRSDVMTVGLSNELAIIDMIAQNIDYEDVPEGKKDYFNPNYDIKTEADADLIVAIVRANLKGVLGKAKNANFIRQITENRDFKFVGKEESGDDSGGVAGSIPFLGG